MLTLGDGIHHDGCIPDLAFNLFANVGCSNTSPAGHGDPTVGCFSFRTDQYPQQAMDVANLLRDLCRRSWKGGMLWRPIVQVARDRAGMEALQHQLRSQDGTVEPPVDLHGDVEACLGFYRGISLAISNRLHVLLMAASQGARILALTSGPGGAKLEGILHDLGLDGAIGDGSGTGEHHHAGIRLNGEEQRRTLNRAFDDLLEIASTSDVPLP